MSSIAKPTGESEDKRPIVIYSMPGSQFTAKVLAALQARNIEHYVCFVPLDLKKRSKLIPSGGTLVPEMQVGTGGDATIVSDSEAILHWLSDHKEAAQFYPVMPACSEISIRASDKKLAGLVWYYNWVSDQGFDNSMRKFVRAEAIPKYISWMVPNMVIPRMLASTRAKFRAQAAGAIGVEDERVLDNEETMQQILIDELLFFQSLLKKDSTQQPYLIEGTTQPTAADFSVYAQLERLVGDGTASDVYVHPAIQHFKEQSKKDFGIVRLWEWYDDMRAKFPVQFKGRRTPSELLKR